MFDSTWQQIVRLAVELAGVEVHHLHQADRALAADRRGLEPRVLGEQHAGQQAGRHLQPPRLLHDRARDAAHNRRVAVVATEQPGQRPVVVARDHLALEHGAVHRKPDRGRGRRAGEPGSCGDHGGKRGRLERAGRRELHRREQRGAGQGDEERPPGRADPCRTLVGGWRVGLNRRLPARMSAANGVRWSLCKNRAHAGRSDEAALWLLERRISDPRLAAQLRRSSSASSAIIRTSHGSGEGSSSATSGRSCGVSRISGTPALRRSLQQPPERLHADPPLPDQHVPVLVGSQPTFAVVEMEEGRRLAGGRLELVEDGRSAVRRRGDVVPRREQVAGVEPVAGARPERRRHRGEDRADLVGRPADRVPAPAVFSTSIRVAPFTARERLGDRAGHALRPRRRGRRRWRRPDGSTRRPRPSAVERSSSLARPAAARPHLSRPLVAVLSTYAAWTITCSGRDSRLARAPPGSAHPLGPDRGLVAVVLGDGGEDLERCAAGAGRRGEPPCGCRRCPRCERRRSAPRVLR